MVLGMDALDCPVAEVIASQRQASWTTSAQQLVLDDLRMLRRQEPTCCACLQARATPRVGATPQLHVSHSGAVPYLIPTIIAIAAHCASAASSNFDAS